MFGSSVCNFLPRRDRCRGWRLSVPCVRVECLQPIAAALDELGTQSFSTLCSGRVFATATGPTHGAEARTFSTLCSGRVFATLHASLVEGNVIHFQYPVFGSSVCNPAPLPSRGGAGWLSVPCVRVECLQLRKKTTTGPTGGLSVPCVRVECLQLDTSDLGGATIQSFSTLCSGRVFATQELFLPGDLDYTCFQYPVFGSSVCNLRQHLSL